MQTKLTLRVDSRLITRAKVHAQQSGKSVSQLVADYFAIMDISSSSELGDLPPITRELHGALANANVDETDFHTHLEEKYR